MKRYVWGFPGVGKSSLDVSGLVIEDADCRRFQFRNVAPEDLHGQAGGRRFVRDESYPQNYLDFVRTVEADVVLLNCHISLLSQFGRENVLIVYPGAELLPEYLERYRSRGDDESFVSYMEDEAPGIIRFIETSDFEKYRIEYAGAYLEGLFERSDFKMKLMTRTELTEQLQRAIDLGVMIETFQAGDNAWLKCDAKYAGVDITDIQASVNFTVARAEDAARLADAVLDGKFQLDIDQLIHACITREEKVKEEQMLLVRRGGLSREELADKIMQGIVNGALGIEHDEIAPYSRGYEVTFGGIGTIGSTRDFKNRWECYCDFFDVPMRIVDMIEKEKQDGRVFGKDVKLLDIHEMLRAIETMERNKIQGFIPEKDTPWQRTNYPHRLGHVATVMDVHAGKGLDGIIQHHYHGTYSTMTTVKQNNLVETLVCMKGFCLDCIDMLDIGKDGRQKVVDYLKKHGTDISTPKKMRAWIRKNPEHCGREQNRVVQQLDDSFYARAYSDFIELQSLVDAHTGSLNDFVVKQGLFGDWYENSFNTSFGALTDVYLYEREDGSLGLSDCNICVWDHEHDVGEEDLLFSDIKAKCEKLGFNLEVLKEKALGKVEAEREGLDELICAASPAQNYELTLFLGEENEKRIQALLTDEQVQLVHQGMSGILSAEYEITLKDGTVLEVGNIDAIEALDSDFLPPMRHYDHDGEER